MLAWSLSRLQKSDCLAKFKALYIDKTVKESMSPAGQKGIDDHTALERYVAEGAPLPAHLQKFQPGIDRLKDFPIIVVEKEFAITRDFQFVDWFDANVWFRLKADVLAFKDGKCLYVDYKTGKRKSDRTQIKLTALLVFKHYSDVIEFRGTNWWLQQNIFDAPIKVRRDDIPYLESWFYKLPKHIYEALDSERFPYQPSAEACRFCPVHGCPERHRS